MTVYPYLGPLYNYYRKLRRGNSDGGNLQSSGGYVFAVPPVSQDGLLVDNIKNDVSYYCPDVFDVISFIFSPCLAF